LLQWSRELFARDKTLCRSQKAASDNPEGIFMASFSVRIELLHNATTGDYSGLHDRMRGAGFQTHVISDGGQKLALPPAEYFGQGQITLTKAREEAVKAVQSGLRAGLSFRAFVSQSDGWAGHNLATA
jgi:hypothetical protein